MIQTFGQEKDSVLTQNGFMELKYILNNTNTSYNLDNLYNFYNL